MMTNYHCSPKIKQAKIKVYSLDQAEHASMAAVQLDASFPVHTLMVTLKRISDLVSDLLLNVLCSATMMLDNFLAVFQL